MNQANRYEPGPSRRTFYRTLCACLTGVIIGAFATKPLLGFFDGFAPWVGPAVFAGIAGLTMLTALLLPLKKGIVDDSRQ